MNVDRRKRLAKIVSELDDQLQALDALKAEDRDAFEAMPEGLQNSERGQAASEAADALDNAYDALESVISDLGAIE